MDNLRVKTQMTPPQLGVVIVAASICGEIILRPSSLLREAGHEAWLSLLLAGLLYFAGAWMILQLGNWFPEETFVEYMPHLWGRLGAAIVILWFLAIPLGVMSGLCGGFAKVINVYMLPRTPDEFLVLVTLAVAMYGALQDLGTLVKVLQVTLFTSILVAVFISLLSYLEFQLDYVLPLWTGDVSGLLSGIAVVWWMYIAAPIMLVLLPDVSRKGPGLLKVLGYSYGFMTLLYIAIVTAAVGALGIEAGAKSTYPVHAALNEIDVPGTFIERLDNYLLLFTIPSEFNTMSVLFFVSARTLARCFGQADHRPWVFALAPVAYIFSGIACMSSAPILEKTMVIIGLGFMLVVVPASFARAWWLKRRTTYD